MRKVILFALLTTSTFAGQCTDAWFSASNMSSMVQQLSQGSYISMSTSSSFNVDVHTSSSTDTATFYLTDANGVVASDTVTVTRGASAYAMGGGVKRRWLLTGRWRLVLTKAVGIITADVCQ